MVEKSAYIGVVGMGWVCGGSNIEPFGLSSCPRYAFGVKMEVLLTVDSTILHGKSSPRPNFERQTTI
jgi:hypothetical protein